MRNQVEQFKRRLSGPLALVAAIIGLAGCGGGGATGSDDTRAAQARDFEKLEAQYSAVEGVYEGMIQFDEPGLPSEAAKLNVYRVYISDGVNPDGSARMRPALRGRFRLENVISETDSEILAGDYNPVSGQVILTTLSSGSGAAGDARMLSMQGPVRGPDVSLAAVRRGGPWGQFTGQRISSEASSSAAGTQAEERQRRLRILQPLVGRYVGVIQNPRPGTEFKCVDFTLSVQETSSALGYIPSLMAQFAYTRLSEDRIGERTLSIEYNGQTGEVSMREVAAPTSPIPGSGILSVVGSLSRGSAPASLSVQFSDSRGRVGDIVAELGREPQVCRDERARR